MATAAAGQMKFEFTGTLPTIHRWEDIRMPEAYYQHFKETGECINCRMHLGHDMHAFNHYKKFHVLTIVPEPRKQKRSVRSAKGK
jgi:hypothetical protein